MAELGHETRSYAGQEAAQVGKRSGGETEAEFYGYKCGYSLDISAHFFSHKSVNSREQTLRAEPRLPRRIIIPVIHNNKRDL
jgi:hypothetical protein